MTRNTKGIILSILAAMAVSSVFVFSKAALKEVHLAQFGVYWFGLGIIWNLIFIFSFKKASKIKLLDKGAWKGLGIVAFLEMVGTLCFFLAINTVDNPAVVSFLANINPFIVTCLGFLMLKERFNRIEILGMLITLIGAFVISYQGSKIGSLFIDGTWYVILSGISLSLAAIVAKKNITKLDPSFLALARILLLFLLSLLSIIYLDLSFILTQSAMVNITIGSVLGPFLTATLGYLSMKYIEVSKAAMVRTVRSLFVIIGSYLLLGNLPELIQLVGGGLTIVGVILISLGKIRLNKSKKT